MSATKHIPTPYRLSFVGPICIGIQSGDFYSSMVCNTILPDTDEEYAVQKVEIEDTAKFIVEACNNYYRLKEQNEKLLSATKECIQIMDEECAAEEVYKILSEAIKFCES